MYCRKCGARLKETFEFCDKCGASINGKKKKEIKNKILPIITDEDYTTTYVGNNYKTISERKFSFSAFFFDFFYLLYRKMWLYGFGLLISYIIVCIFAIKFLVVYVIIMKIVLGLSFNKLYIQHINQKINKIKEENNNKQSLEILNICKKKGGVSVGTVVISSILAVIVIITLILIYIGYIINQKFVNNNNKINTKKYDNELIYNVSSDFEANKFNTDSYANYYYNQYGDYCSISVSNYSNILFNDAEEYLKSNIYTYNKDNIYTITNTNINDYEWKYVNVNSDTTNRYYYATVYNNRLYHIEYFIYQDNNKKCSNYYNDFINTITFDNNSI